MRNLRKIALKHEENLHYLYFQYILLINQERKLIHLEDFQTKSHVNHNLKKKQNTIFSNNYGQWKSFEGFCLPVGKLFGCLAFGHLDFFVCFVLEVQKSLE